MLLTLVTIMLVLMVYVIYSRLYVNACPKQVECPACPKQVECPACPKQLECPACPKQLECQDCTDPQFVTQEVKNNLYTKYDSLMRDIVQIHPVEDGYRVNDPKEYEPVCVYKRYQVNDGTDKYKNIKYFKPVTNLFLARKTGYSATSFSEDTCNPPLKEDVICPEIHEPSCGLVRREVRDQGLNKVNETHYIEKDFKSQCEADANDAIFVKRGRCAQHVCNTFEDNLP